MKAAKWVALLLVLLGISPALSGAQSEDGSIEWTTLVSGPLKADYTCENLRCVVVNGGETSIRGSIELHDRHGRIRKSAAFEIDPGEVASVDHEPPQRYATRYCRVHVGRDPGVQPLVEGRPFEVVGSLEMYNCSGQRYLTTPLREITLTSCGDENACTTDW